MRKSAASAALITAVGLSALTTAPATAAILPFPNCDAAAAAGVYNIPTASPAYAPALDSDSDGVGCESDIYAYDTAKVAEIVATQQQLEGLPPHTGIVAGPGGTGLQEAPQIEQVPVGGADTGVAVDTAEGNGATAVTGGLALTVALAAGVLLLRRRARTT
ncbi:excalibur calcium-binding domain-containing protein [Kocuria oceani]|uniref:excalibur calcium-binding domain-containing protein n=1 Tax=Kocuria oceani TaxID=988827 RepID=UPI0040355110